MSYAYHQRKEKMLLRMGYREPRKTVEELKVEMEAQLKVTEERRRELATKVRAEKEVRASLCYKYITNLSLQDPFSYFGVHLTFLLPWSRTPRPLLPTSSPPLTHPPFPLSSPAT